MSKNEITSIIILVVLCIALIAIAIIAYSLEINQKAYYAGQIDALNGKVVVELQDENGAKVWTATQPAKSIWDEKYHVVKKIK